MLPVVPSGGLTRHALYARPVSMTLAGPLRRIRGRRCPMRTRKPLPGSPENRWCSATANGLMVTMKVQRLRSRQATASSSRLALSRIQRPIAVMDNLMYRIGELSRILGRTDVVAGVRTQHSDVALLKQRQAGGLASGGAGLGGARALPAFAGATDRCEPAGHRRVRRGNRSVPQQPECPPALRLLPVQPNRCRGPGGHPPTPRG